MYGFDRPPRPAVVRLGVAPLRRPEAHRCAYLGQNATCETTREGGTVCSDGTYHPPGCPTLPPVRAEDAPGSGATVPILIGVGGLGIVAAIFALTR